MIFRIYSGIGQNRLQRLQVGPEVRGALVRRPIQRLVDAACRQGLHGPRCLVEFEALRFPAKVAEGEEFAAFAFLVAL